jgi:hypothetical protein
MLFDEAADIQADEHRSAVSECPVGDDVPRGVLVGDVNRLDAVDGKGCQPLDVA